MPGRYEEPQPEKHRQIKKADVKKIAARAISASAKLTDRQVPAGPTRSAGVRRLLAEWLVAQALVSPPRCGEMPRATRCGSACGSEDWPRIWTPNMVKPMRSKGTG